VNDRRNLVSQTNRLHSMPISWNTPMLNEMAGRQDRHDFVAIKLFYEGH